MSLSAEQILDGVPQASILTVDFFDTLVTRSVAQPTHVFAVMERDLIAEFGLQWKGFAVQRVHAEHEARRCASHDDEDRDVHIDEIYAQLAAQRSLSFSERRSLIERERATEVVLVQSVAFGQQLTSLARSRGHRVVIVSDNYMPAEHLVDMAHAAGYDWVTVNDVFVSCENNGMKHNGKLWDTVISTLGVDPSHILHVGDDEFADGSIPRARGIQTFIRESMRRSHRVMENTNPSVLPLSRIEASLRDTYADADWPIAAVLGAGAVALLVSAQIVDVLNAIKNRPVAGIHFVARDGFIAHEVWNALRSAGHDLPPATYTALSRSVIWRAGLTTVTEETVHRFIGDSETMSHVRLERRVGCALTGSDSPTTMLTAAQARKILVQNAQSIEGASAVLRQNLLTYLRSHGVLATGHHLIVDLGWTGSTIAELSQLVANETKGEATIEGRLMGAYWDIAPHRARVPLHAFAVDEFAGVDDNIRLLGCQSMFESIVTAPHGSVIDYTESGGEVRPVFADTPAELAAYETYGREIADSAIASAVQILRATHASGVSQIDVTPDVAWAAMMQVGHTPRPDEVRLLSSVRHVTAIDHEGDGDGLIADVPKNEKTASGIDAAYNQLIHHHWVQGSLVAWGADPHACWMRDEIRRIWPVFQQQWVQIP